MSDATAGNAGQVDYWNSVVGRRWADLQARIDTAFAGVTAALLDVAAPAQGSAALDVGCGAGATVLALAAAAGPAGRVLGVDVSRPMLEVAERRVAAAGLAGVRLLLADAATEAFEPGGFDLVASRFGVMFFADPVAALRNIRAALKPGGRLAFACWQPLDASPFFAVPMAALRPLLPPPATPPDPHAPGPFAFADADRVRRILAEAGFRDIAVEPRRVAVALGSPEEAVDFVRQVGPASRALGDAEPARKPAMLEALRAALQPHEGPDGTALAGEVWLVSARP